MSNQQLVNLHSEETWRVCIPTTCSLGKGSPLSTCWSSDWRYDNRIIVVTHRVISHKRHKNTKASEMPFASFVPFCG